MQRLATNDLWPRLRRLAGNAKCRIAAVAYVTRAEDIRFGDGDILVVDASDQAIKSGMTATTILRAAHHRGAQIFSCNGLHAKVFLLGDVAVIGSANISAASVNQKIEAALITDNRVITSSVRSMISHLMRQSTPIDDAFLARIGKIKVSKRILPESSRKRAVPNTSRRDGEEEAARRTRAHHAVVRMLTDHGIRPNNPREIVFDNATFAFTGRFEYGTQAKCAQATEARGGYWSPSNHVTESVNVLVIGEKGSPTYLWKKYGKKLVHANQLRQQWRTPLIVTEERWRKEIDR